ncbi:MAG: hypothetical protein KY475_04480 [Planctomycetes bacterium]|nr:hypothetical protein [Planctomycetota bacterium]
MARDRDIPLRNLHMQLKSYRAPTIQEAIELVRRDLGPDAAVLHAREAPRSGLARWFGRRLIEVTASPDAEAPSRFGPPARAKPQQSARKQGIH